MLRRRPSGRCGPISSIGDLAGLHALAHPQKPVLQYELMNPGSTLSVSGRDIESIPVKHIVPGVGYRVSAAGKSFAFSGDTCTNDSLWAALNQHGNLDLLIVECAFANEDLELSQLAAHYCPSLLAADMVKLRHRPALHLTHLKPGSEDAIFSECRAAMADRDPQRLFADRSFSYNRCTQGFSGDPVNT